MQFKLQKMKKLLCIITVIGAIILLIVSCDQDPAKVQLKKLKQLSITFAKDQLKKEIDSVQITKIDTLTQLGYAKVTLEMLENMDEQYQLDYYKALAAQNEELSTELETYLGQVEELKQEFTTIVDDAVVDNRKTFLYMYQVNYWRDGGFFDVILFATPSYKLHELDPFQNNLLEK